MTHYRRSPSRVTPQRKSDHQARAPAPYGLPPTHPLRRQPDKEIKGKGLAFTGFQIPAFPGLPRNQKACSNGAGKGRKKA